MANQEMYCLDLSQRAEHPSSQLKCLHGSLYDIKCSNESCDWMQKGNFDDPFCASLAPASVDMPNGEPLPLLDPYHRIKHITEDELPRCPKCRTGLQRPGVVWFGEDLDSATMMEIAAWLNTEPLVCIYLYT
jgi:NAD-dependent SIR2 family protein deacetylase